MKNLTKKTMILGLMTAFLFPFGAMAQRGNGNGNGNTGSRGGKKTTPRHKPKPQKQKPAYRYGNYGHKPHYRRGAVHKRPTHYRHQRPTRVVRHRPTYRYSHRTPRYRFYGQRNVHFGMRIAYFNSLNNNLNRSAFDRERLAMAKVAIANNGVSTDQVINLMNKLTFDRNRLELAKFAFDYVVDPGQYFIVVDNLEFYSNRRALLNYIQ